MAFEEAAGGPGPYFAPSAPPRLPGGNPFLPDSNMCFLPYIFLKLDHDGILVVTKCKWPRVRGREEGEGKEREFSEERFN